MKDFPSWLKPPKPRIDPETALTVVILALSAGLIVILWKFARLAGVV
jgi:hypothetical protein